MPRIFEGVFFKKNPVFKSCGLGTKLPDRSIIMVSKIDQSKTPSKAHGKITCILCVYP